jgi:hypothetical protein
VRREATSIAATLFSRLIRVSAMDATELDLKSLLTSRGEIPVLLVETFFASDAISSALDSSLLLLPASVGSRFADTSRISVLKTNTSCYRNFKITAIEQNEIKTAW